MHLVESGFIEHWKRKYWPQEKCDLQSTTILAKAVTLEELSGSYYILLGGIVVSFLFLIGERIFIHKRSGGADLPTPHAHDTDGKPGSSSGGGSGGNNSELPVSELHGITRTNPLFNDCSDSDESKAPVPRLNNELCLRKEDNITNSFKMLTKPVINHNDWQGSVKRSGGNVRSHVVNRQEIHLSPRKLNEEVSALRKDIPVNGINEHVI